MTIPRFPSILETAVFAGSVFRIHPSALRKRAALPALTPTIITLTLLSVGKIFYSDFGLFYQVPMNSGPLLDVTNTIDTYVYRGLIQLNDLGMSSAAGVYQSLVGFILVLAANKVVSRVDKDNALF